jgi:hypothetical protein
MKNKIQDNNLNKFVILKLNIELYRVKLILFLYHIITKVMLRKNEKFHKLEFRYVPKITWISQYLMKLLTKQMISNVLKNWIKIHSLFLLNNL